MRERVRERESERERVREIARERQREREREREREQRQRERAYEQKGEKERADWPWRVMKDNFTIPSSPSSAFAKGVCTLNRPHTQSAAGGLGYQPTAAFSAASEISAGVGGVSSQHT